jgi:hypothetical protein
MHWRIRRASWRTLISTPASVTLIDFTHVTNFELEAKGVRRLAQRSIFSPDSRRAILVASDLAFGFSRMFEIYRETAGEKGIHVFRNLDDALDWILAKHSAAWKILAAYRQRPLGSHVVKILERLEMAWLRI